MAGPRMRVGVFGGTFDPVHLAHLILAEQCREQARLDQVLFVPAAVPPHKQHRAVTPFGQRVEMLSLAIAGNPVFRIDELEKDRPGPSYTVDTLTQLHAARPDDELFFILGTDSLRDLPTWYQPRRILELAGLVIHEREGFPPIPEKDLREALELGSEFPLRMQNIQAPLIAVSSQDIRKRIGEGHSVRYMIPRAVEAYIAEKGLYR
ncbi:MAG TPA: nicotinate-nucleotide adenylyltransferase [Gemmataceae bacterium]|nr:nicotinate-nucleotide adenylyltransferase [Gemmataceae bacterium]